MRYFVIRMIIIMILFSHCYVGDQVAIQNLHYGDKILSIAAELEHDTVLQRYDSSV